MKDEGCNTHKVYDSTYEACASLLIGFTGLVIKFG